MPWFKLDDGFYDHPKVVRAGPEAGWLYVVGGVYCARHLTDGWIPRDMVPRLTPLKRPLHLAGILVAVELWHESHEDFYEVHDYLDYNPSRTEMTDAAEVRSAKASRAARARWDATSNAPSIAQASDEPMLEGMLENAPYPYPSPSSNSSIAEKLEADFDVLWQSYPRKEARKDALKAYLARRREGVEYADLERAIGHYAQSAVGKERTFIMLGATFLGPNERWRDFLEPPPDVAGKVDEAAYWRQFKP